MYKLKRTLSLTLAMVMAASLVLGGCGKQDPVAEESTQASNSSTTAVTEVSKELPDVNLTWYNIGGAPKDIDLVNDELNKYLKKEINATVEMKFLDWGVYSDRLNVMKAAGDSFDIFFNPGWMSYRQDVAKGYLKDVTELWGQYAPKTKEQLNVSFVEGSKVNGKNYGIPANKELAHGQGVLIRKDIAQKYNLDLSTIKSYKDLEPMLEVIKAKEPSMIPLNCSKDDNMIFALDWDKLNDNVAGVVRYGETKVINELEAPETVELLNTARAWFQKGYINADAATLGDRKPNMKAGKAFAQFTPINPGTAANESNAFGFEFEAIELTPRNINTGDTTGSLQCISVTSNNPERALMFLELVNTDVYVNNLINFGIEKTHYVKKSEAIIDLPEGVTAETTAYRPQSQWIFGNNYINYLWSNEDPKKWEKFEEFNKSAASSKLLGFSFDTTPIKNEVGAMSNINQQYGPGLYTGTIDPNKALPEYIDKLKQAGLDKVLAEKQKQIDAWLAGK